MFINNCLEFYFLIKIFLRMMMMGGTLSQQSTRIKERTKTRIKKIENKKKKRKNPSKRLISTKDIKIFSWKLED